MGKKLSFPGVRRVLATAATVGIVYMISHSIGSQIGLSESIDPTILKFIIMSAAISAILTKWLHTRLMSGEKW